MERDKKKKKKKNKSRERGEKERKKRKRRWREEGRECGVFGEGEMGGYGKFLV